MDSSDGNVIDHRSLYRLPWTLPDNGICWLEPTARCNLNCYGCYRKNQKESHKSMEQVRHELDVFQSLRKTDCISIAGGDPLLYPDIVELIAEIKRRGIKPIVNTNGIALTKELLHDLKKAGVFGFTFHIDSKQGRGRGPAWEGKTELELCDLRLHYAEMLASEGGISCSFNSTVYGDTLQYVPDLVTWAHKHVDIVHTMVFILFRYITPELPYDFYAGDRKIVWEKIHYHSDKSEITNIHAQDVVQEIRKRFPEFSPAAFLNGTQQADSYKWLLSERIATKDRVLGYANGKFLEMVMASYHMMHDRYLSYAGPGTTQLGRSALWLLWPFNKSIRKSLGRYLGYLAGNPLRVFKKVHMQSLMIIQPVDFMPNGDQNMCDGCPDITVWKDGQGKDRLVWSCRLEEPVQYGNFLHTVPRQEVTQ
jgi:hypothetical protein